MGLDLSLTHSKSNMSVIIKIHEKVATEVKATNDTKLSGQNCDQMMNDIYPASFITASYILIGFKNKILICSNSLL